MNEENTKIRRCIGCHKKLVSKESWLCGRCRLNATKYAGSLLGFASIGTASVAIAISGSSDDKKDGDALE